MIHGGRRKILRKQVLLGKFAFFRDESIYSEIVTIYLMQQFIVLQIFQIKVIISDSHILLCVNHDTVTVNNGSKLPRQSIDKNQYFLL